GAKLKDQVLLQLEHQDQLQSYRFHGRLSLHLSPVLNSAAYADSALTASLLDSMLDGTFTWDGKADEEAGKLEMKLGIQPAQSDASFSLPLLFEQNHLYFRIPLLNAPEEYWAVDMQQYSPEVSAAALSSAFNQMFLHAAEGMEA